MSTDQATEEQTKGYLYLATAMILVGSTVVASKIIAGGLPPFTATALRFLIALPIFVLLMKFRNERWPRPDKHDLILLLLQAGAGSVGYTVLLILGTSFTSSGDAGIIAGTLPAVAAATAFIALGERPDLRMLAALALAVAGTLVVAVSSANGGMVFAPKALLGDGLVFAAVVCEAIFILLNKRLHQPLAALPLSTLMSAIGFALAIFPALFEHAWRQTVDWYALSGVVYYAFFPTVCGFLLWYAGAARAKGSEAALLTGVVPAAAVILSALVLREPVRVAQIVGIACVLAAIAMMAGRRTTVAETP